MRTPQYNGFSPGAGRRKIAFTWRENGPLNIGYELGFGSNTSADPVGSGVTGR
jgi:hypothetical protein